MMSGSGVAPRGHLPKAIYDREPEWKEGAPSAEALLPPRRRRASPRPGDQGACLPLHNPHVASISCFWRAATKEIPRGSPFSPQRFAL